MSSDTVYNARPDILRYGVRMVQGQDASAREQAKPGAFGRFLSGIGRVLGAIAMPMSLIFPPAALGAAAMYGVGMLGDQSQARTMAKQQEKAGRESATNVAFPGLDLGMGPMPAVGQAASEFGVRDVLEGRGNTVSAMSNRI